MADQPTNSGYVRSPAGIRPRPAGKPRAKADDHLARKSLRAPVPQRKTKEDTNK
jgi:hypothetical protein